MMKNILVTGASGKTGKAIVSALSVAGFSVTAFTHKQIYSNELLKAGAASVKIGDLRSEADLQDALHNQQGIYHICPNMTADEFAIGKNIIHLCQEQSVNRFVFHSVLHPQVQSMPHHWQKLQVEEELLQSKLAYTILQPSAYMQNILGYRDSILQGVFPMPYSTKARISLVDIRDVARVAARAFADDSMIYGIYELAGTLPLSQDEVAVILSEVLHRSVAARQLDQTVWYEDVVRKNMPAYTRDTLLSMFKYYDKCGLAGSPAVLTCLLGQKPITIDQFILDELLNHVS
jgi:uncharacterized protein YbjT (DUF2867 family)